MATRHYRAQVVIPHDSGLPEDAVVNTWHYLASDSLSDAGNAEDFDGQLQTFYSGWVNALGSTAMNWNASEIRHTVFEDPTPRLPFALGSFTALSPPTAYSDWPPDVAIVLSMQGTKSSGDNMRRRRGRVYLGPLAFAAGDQPQLDTGSADTVANAASSAFFSSGTSVLCVYSPYTHHGIAVGQRLTKDDPEVPAYLAASFVEVDSVWVDNAFDTQRRRGLRASYRHTHSR